MPKIGVVPYEQVDVDLFGTEFISVPSTRSTIKAARQLQDANQELLANEKGIDDLTADEADALVAYFGAILDLRLKANGNGRTKPSTLLTRKWEGDELQLAQVLQLMQDIQSAEAEARPT